MPCHGGPIESPADLRAERDKLTRLLCEACRMLESEGHRLVGEMAQWWEDHKAFDRGEGR